MHDRDRRDARRTARPAAGRPGRSHRRPRLGDPIEPEGGLVALFGSLAPGGAILKRSAADKRLLEHTGRAVVFSSLDDLAARIDLPDLDVTADDILVLQNAGPKSEAAMPEAGYLPIPKKLAHAGVKDMVRVSDARMSGTAYGAVVLHVTPDAASGGPLALVETGDRIRLSVKEKRIDLLVGDNELDRRRAALILAREAGERDRPQDGGGGGTRAAAMTASTTTTSSRPTRAATSTSARATRRRARVQAAGRCGQWRASRPAILLRSRRIRPPRAEDSWQASRNGCPRRNRWGRRRAFPTTPRR